MSLVRNKWLWVALLGVLLSGGLLVLTVGYVAVVAYSALVSTTSLVGVLLDIAVPVLVALAVLLTVFVGSGIGLLWVLVRHASVRSERVASLAERVEREYPPLRAVGLSDVLAPPEPSAEEQAEAALADLKQQYVEGEISEAEFERKVDRLVATDSIDEARAAAERRELERDGASGGH